MLEKYNKLLFRLENNKSQWIFRSNFSNLCGVQIGTAQIEDGISTNISTRQLLVMHMDCPEKTLISFPGSSIYNVGQAEVWYLSQND